LGGLYTVLRNKYYFDELYDALFVKNAVRLSNWLFRFDSGVIDDTIVDGAGWVGRKLSEIGHWIDEHIVDAAVNGAGAITNWFGGAVRVIQTGKAQNYLLVGLVSVSVLLGAFLLLPK
jgi:NADH:ubiquinone oxidoreductase subunit 5 (subunit L)/multisubunit Na+/H+ antiporter MnhA subunit